MVVIDETWWRLLKTCWNGVSDHDKLFISKKRKYCLFVNSTLRGSNFILLQKVKYAVIIYAIRAIQRVYICVLYILYLRLSSYFISPKIYPRISASLVPQQLSEHVVPGCDMFFEVRRVVHLALPRSRLRVALVLVTLQPRRFVPLAERLDEIGPAVLHRGLVNILRLPKHKNKVIFIKTSEFCGFVEGTSHSSRGWPQLVIW